MAHYQTKPVTVEAVQVSDILQVTNILKSIEPDWEQLPNWIAEAYQSGKITVTSFSLRLFYFGRWLSASGEDWLVRNAKDELHICKSVVFASTYERVAE